MEPSTIRGYRHESKLICRYIGDIRLGELGIAEVNGFMARMTGDGIDVRTVASYLGHSSVSMTLNTYADVDPDAKLQAIGKIEDSFDIDMDMDMDSLPLS